MLYPKEYRLETGDVELAVSEWPGAGDPILLLHATGFHSRCWNQVVRHLPGRHIYAADLRFHGTSGASGPVSWRVMAEDIRLLIAQLKLTRLVGVGHSIGGYLIAYAAARAPQCFKHLLLIDPVIMSARSYARFQTVSADIGGGVAAGMHPVARRKNAWRDSREMYESFKGRAPFNTWQDDVLRDYCDYALSPGDEHALRKLACDPIHEAGIYLNQRGNEVILEELTGIVTPVTLLRAPYGGDSTFDLTSSPTWPGLAAALPNCQEVYLPDMNHFIPMQDPALVAHYIRAAR